MEKHCLIITAHIDAPETLPIDGSQYSCVICADGGLTHARALGIQPDYLIGDFDSESGIPPVSTDSGSQTGSAGAAAASENGAVRSHCEIIRLPAEKDMTDTEAAIDLAVSLGCQRITCLGGLGGRFDHTMGNIGMLSKYCGSGIELDFVDGINRVTMLPPGTYRVPRGEWKYLGFFAWGGPVTGLTLSGTKYPLADFTLHDDTSRCVSNEITDDPAAVTFRTGRLLMIQSSDIR